MKKSPNFLQSGDYFLTFRGSTSILLPKVFFQPYRVILGFHRHYDSNDLRKNLREVSLDLSALCSNAQSTQPHRQQQMGLHNTSSANFRNTL